jgi:hypothetical protein
MSTSMACGCAIVHRHIVSQRTRRTRASPRYVRIFSHPIDRPPCKEKISLQDLVAFHGRLPGSLLSLHRLCHPAMGAVVGQMGHNPRPRARLCCSSVPDRAIIRRVRVCEPEAARPSAQHRIIVPMAANQWASQPWVGRPSPINRWASPQLPAVALSRPGSSSSSPHLNLFHSNFHDPS